MIIPKPISKNDIVIKTENYEYDDGDRTFNEDVEVEYVSMTDILGALKWLRNKKIEQAPHGLRPYIIVWDDILKAFNSTEKQLEEQRNEEGYIICNHCKNKIRCKEDRGNRYGR